MCIIVSLRWSFWCIIHGSISSLSWARAMDKHTMKHTSKQTKQNQLQLCCAQLLVGRSILLFVGLVWLDLFMFGCVWLSYNLAKLVWPVFKNSCQIFKFATRTWKLSFSSNQVQSVPISSNLAEFFVGTSFCMLVKFGFLHYGQIPPSSMGFSLSNQFQSVQSVPISSNLAKCFSGDLFLHACSGWFSSPFQSVLICPISSNQLQSGRNNWQPF